MSLLVLPVMTVISMQKQPFSRRQFLQVTGTLAAGMGLSACGINSEPSVERGLILSADDDADGKHYLTGFHLQQGKQFSVEVPFRGHGLCVNPAQAREVILFGRRPAMQCAAINTDTQHIAHTFNATSGRHFYGHGCFSADGRYLFTTENDYANGVGKIGIRSLPDYQHVGEFPSYGIGPHDIHLLSDGYTLVVANGGIQTHPDYPRRKLNLPTMSPSLTYIDSRSGALIDRYTLDNHQLSIRHLHVSENDDVGAALQFKGKRASLKSALPLIAIQRSGGPLSLVDGPESIMASLSYYTADICLNPVAGVFAVTSPRGDKVTFWDYKTQAFIGEHLVQGVSGIVNSRDYRSFIISTGKGVVQVIDAHSRTIIEPLTATFNATRWDNHMVIA